MDEIRKISKSEFPTLLKEINDPPKELFIRGTFPSEENKFLCVVGSRKYTSYGRDVCERLIAGLQGQPIVIVSGLALGLDAIAHKAALDAGITTVAVPGSGLGWDVLHPKTNHGLAKQILQAGGALVSEFEDTFKATTWSFPQRNRIMAGMSHAILILEGVKKSGTMITARLATEYNRDVLAVPGPITAPASEGTNWLIKTDAIPATSSADILEALELEAGTTKKLNIENMSENEKKVTALLHEPLARDELIRQLSLPTHEANALLSAMEIKGLTKESLGKVHLTFLM